MLRGTDSQGSVCEERRWWGSEEVKASDCLERTLRGCQVWRQSQWGRVARKLLDSFRGEATAGLDTAQDWTGAMVGKPGKCRAWVYL